MGRMDVERGSISGSSGKGEPAGPGILECSSTEAIYDGERPASRNHRPSHPRGRCKRGKTTQI
jgi:hypothetical protein